MIHNLVKIAQLCIIVFSLDIITCDIDYLFDDTFVIRNTDRTISISLTATFDSEEGDDALLKWEDSSKRPALDYYYVYPKSIQTRIVAITLGWNAERTDMERKYGGGVLLFTVLKNFLPVGNKTLEVVVHWRPETPSVLRSPVTGDILRNTTLIMTCSGDKGNPSGNVTWKINGTDMTDDMYKLDKININSVQAEHDGDYSCYFTNGLGSGGESGIQTVEVKWTPGTASVLRNPASGNILHDSTLIMTCSGDRGNPTGNVTWKINGTVMTDTMYKTDIITINEVKANHGGDWSCLFTNGIGSGDESAKQTIEIKLTYSPPNITLDVTAVSLTIGIKSNEPRTTESENRRNRNKRMTEQYGISHYTTIKLTGNGESISTNKSISISEYTFYNLQPETSYNISVIYYNDFGEGGPAFETFTTKPSPVSETPSITRNLLTAVVQMTIGNPDSASEIRISVCSIDETDPSNCNTENVTAIVVDFREGVYATFSKRYVNVSLYDSGVQVYSYGHNIDIAVVVIILILIAGLVFVGVIIVIIIIVIKKKDKGKKKQEKEEEENIDPYSYSNPNNESRTGTGPGKALNASPVYSVVNKGKPLAPIAASPADGPVYSKVDWSKKDNRQSLKGSPMSKKAIDKIMFVQNDGKINMQFEVSKKFTGDIEMNVCRKGGQSSTSKQHVRGTKNVVMVLPIKETSKDKYAINMNFIAKGQIVQEVDLTYPYEQNSVNVTVLNESYVTSGTDVKAQEMPEYSEVNNSKKTKGPEMPTYSEVNKSKKKKKAAEEQPYEDVETKNQLSHNDRSTNAVSPSNAEVAVEGVPHHPPRKGAPKEGVMYAELDLNNSGPPRLLPRLGSKSPAHEPVVYADVRPG